MSDEGQRQYFNPIPPSMSDTPGVGVTAVPCDVTARHYDMGDFQQLFGKLLELIAVGGTVWVSTSPDGAADIDKTMHTGSPGDENLIEEGTDARNPIPVTTGAVLLVRLDSKKSRYLHVQADTGTATLLIRPASQTKWLGSTRPDGG